MPLSGNFLIVGLGNPGKDYEITRHNLGFLVVEELARQNRLKFSHSVSKEGWLARGSMADRPVYLLKPMTFVNQSGLAVKATVSKEDIPPDNILVICDDVNLPFGQMRLKLRGSHGGHNGLKSVLGHLKTQNIARLRMGVGSPDYKEDMVNFVLSDFNLHEKKKLDAFVNRAVDCIGLWLAEGATKAMSEFNKRKEDE